MEQTEVIVSLDDECFTGCMSELEECIQDGWKLVNDEYDPITNSSLMTLEREIQPA